jgi:predicted enzyme related to lactoylglutathione lyase
MPERTQHAPGTPSWTDLQTTDQEGAKKFYSAIFGWEYDEQPVGQDADGNDAFYSMALKNGQTVAAIGGAPPEGVPSHWNVYVSVADADATAGEVAAAGGQVIAPPFDVMEAGRMAVIADPTGAAFCIWQPKDAIGAGIVNEHGALSWEELMTPDVPKAAAFYKKLLGWESETTPDGSYTEFKLDGRSIGGAMKPPMDGIPPVWGVYFAVDDTDKAVEIAKANGGRAFQEPMDIEPGRFAVLADPAGAMFNVIKMASAAD